MKSGQLASASMTTTLCSDCMLIRNKAILAILQDTTESRCKKALPYDVNHWMLAGTAHRDHKDIVLGEVDQP